MDIKIHANKVLIFLYLRVILNSKKYYENTMKNRYTAKEKALHYITLNATLPIF